MSFQYPGSDRSKEEQLARTIEFTILVLGILYVIHRAFTHHHLPSLAVMVGSSVAAFWVLGNLNMSSDWAYLFFGLLAVVFIAAGKILST